MRDEGGRCQTRINSREGQTRHLQPRLHPGIQDRPKHYRGLTPDNSDSSYTPPSGFSPTAAKAETLSHHLRCTAYRDDSLPLRLFTDPGAYPISRIRCT